MSRSSIPPRPRLSLPLLSRDPPSPIAAEGSHARVRARLAVPAEDQGCCVRGSRRRRRQHSSSSASSRRWLLTPRLLAAGRPAEPDTLRGSPLSTLPETSLRSSSGRGAVGACAEPPPPRPRPASPRATAARYRRRRCACCSSPSPLQCEGLEDGRLAELRG